MAAVNLLGFALLIWCASFVLLMSRDSMRRSYALRQVLIRLEGLALAAFATLASKNGVAWLLQHRSIAALSDTVTDAALRRGHELITRELSCAALLIFVGVAALGAGLWTRSPLGTLSVLVACVVGIPTWDAAKRRKLAQDLAAEMPGVFRSLAMAMGAGETLSQAIEYVGSHERGVAGRAFMRAALGMRCGISAREALGKLSEELDAPGVGLMSTALLISQRTGSPLRGLFEYSASLVERAQEFERLLTVKTAQVRLSIRIVCLLPLAMLLGLSLLSPDFQKGLTTPVGMICVFIAVVMDVVALAIIRRLMRGVL